jgi:hypothetical protein
MVKVKQFVLLHDDQIIILNENIHVTYKTKLTHHTR